MQKLILALSVVLPLSALAAAPDWLADPGNSRWLVCGGETNGVTILDKTSEGNLQAVAGGWQSVRPDGQPGFFYVVAEPWEQFHAWLGASNDVLLTVRYFDGGAGTLGISYDSADARVKHDPYPAGVWRRPDEYPDGVPLTGRRTWQTLRVRLSLAFFTKRVHGADVRLEGLGKDSVLAGVAFTRVPKGPEPPVLVKQELRVARTVGWESFGAGARFSGRFVQDGAAPIVIEAELANAISPQQGNGVMTDPQASGGGVIHFVANAVYKFTVVSPGQYNLWERSYFPLKGSWNHSESLDGSAPRGVTDGTFGPENGWVWIKAGTYDLRAGEHTFNLDYQGGARLDLLVFSRNDPPPELPTLVSSYCGPTAGEIWTVPVKPFGVVRWTGVRFNLPATATAQSEYSADNGQTWTAFDSKTDLSKLPVTGGGQDSLQFHIKVAARDGKTPFLFGGGVLSYQAGPDNTRVVENDRLKIEIDPYGIRSIYDKRTRLVVAQAAPMHEPLAMLTIKKPGNAAPSACDLFNATLAKCEIGGTAATPVLTMVYEFENHLRVITTGKLLPNGQSEWQMAIDNPTEFEVAEFRFPVVTGIKLGGNPADDWIFVPKPWGQVWKNPAAAGRLANTLGFGAAMRWTALWDEKQGVYLGIEDPRHEDYGFFYGGDSSGGATLSAWQRTLVKPGSTWKSGIFRLALTGGDWHEAADIYRDYAGRTLQPTAVPPYLKWLVDAWNMQQSNPAPAIGWDMVTPGGEMLMAANRQMLDGADAAYTGMCPYPAPAWGTTREFSQKLAVRRALGGFYTPYLDFHLWVAGYSHYPRVATFPKSRLPAGIRIPDDDWYRQNAAYSYDGSYQNSTTDRFAWCNMAMGARGWRDWLQDWTMRYLDWGADGMYFDQFNMIYGNGRLYPDFDTYGCWVPATLAIITKIRQAGRAQDPYYVASGEFCNDLYGQQLDMHMTSAVWNRLDIFRYCIPDQLLVDGEWNGGLSIPEWGGVNRCRLTWQAGARFDNSLDPPKDKRLLTLRRAVKSLLYDAQFRDTVGLILHDSAGHLLTPAFEDSYQGVSGRWFLVSRDGQRGAIVNLINAPVQPGAICSIRTQDFGPVAAAIAVTINGAWRPVAGQQDGDTFTFPVPAAECSSVVLAGRLAPLVEWNIEPAAAPGVVRKLMLKLTNPNAAPLTGTARLRLPRDWRVPAAVAFGPIPSGQAQTFAITLTVPRHARQGRTDIWCDIATPTGNFSAYSLLVVNDPVVADFRGDPGSYHIWLKNLTTEPLTGTVDCRAGASPAVVERTASGALALQVVYPKTFALPPEAEVQVPVQVTGQDKLREISELSATVKVGRQMFHLVRAVMPTVPNGDFEMDGAGDHKPDWWMCRKGDDGWAYDRLHLAEGAHGGKYCLRLDPPQKDEKLSRAYPVNGAFQPGARYRVSVWIKSDSATGVHANVAGQVLAAGQTGPEWKQYTAEFVQGDSPGAGVSLYNESAAPAFFDDLTVREVQK